MQGFYASLPMELAECALFTPMHVIFLSMHTEVILPYSVPFRGAYAVVFNACRDRPWRWGCWVCR